MNIYIYYRISDKGNPKDRVPYADKYSCLANALREFGKDHFYVIADNCSEKTIDFIKSQGVSYEETSLGNAPSFVYMMDKIIQNHKPDDFIYLLEDDYIHRPGSCKVLVEGLSIGDYVTLYDHPDKYYLASAMGGGGGANQSITGNYKKPGYTLLKPPIGGRPIQQP
jgi:hypothetical protein